MVIEPKLQIGKNKITPGVIGTISELLKIHGRIRISFLKSSGRDKVSIKNMIEEIIKNVSLPCKSRTIGFTAILKRQSKLARHKLG